MGSYYAGYALDGDALANAVETLDRKSAYSGAAPLTTSGNIRFTYFTAQTNQTISKIVTASGGTAAGATPTLCRVGFYTVSSAGALTLACAIASDTALWGTQSTEYERSLSTGGGLPATYTFVAGNRYAAGVICVTGAAVPTFVGMSGAINGAVALRAPTITAALSGQTDLPTSVAAASLGASAVGIYVAGIA